MKKILWQKTRTRVLWRRPPSDTCVLAEAIIEHCHQSQEVNHGFWSTVDLKLWKLTQQICPESFRGKDFFYCKRDSDSKRLDY
jgi:hypothetical protein